MLSQVRKLIPVLAKTNANYSTKLTEQQLRERTKFYLDKVCGTKKDIYYTLKHLQREPKDAEELEKLVLDHRRNLLGKALEEAHEAHKINFYN